MGALMLNAEASLYRSSGRYAAVAGWINAALGGVTPAQLPPCGTFTNCVIDAGLFPNCPGHCGHRCGVAGVPPTLECCPPDRCGSPPPSDGPCCTKVCCRASCE